MKVQANVQQQMPLHLYLYKLCITLCVAGILSLFLFACDGAKNSTSNTDTSGVMQNTDTAATMPADTAMQRDTTTMPVQ
ncbi:hypothetical protein [Chitinophaga defluvii]|uniref:Uncharacterized protein n=1 Tax=Chitinophaga defluvii TaxID=3163343 RepID=A0ABV2T2K9_9BACT